MITAAHPRRVPEPVTPTLSLRPAPERRTLRPIRPARLTRPHSTGSIGNAKSDTSNRPEPPGTTPNHSEEDCLCPNFVQKIEDSL